MRADQRQVPMADGKTRYILTVMDDDAPDVRDLRRQMFLGMLADNDGHLLRPGGGAWSRMSIWHDGTRWVAECSAELKGGRT